MHSQRPSGKKRSGDRRQCHENCRFWFGKRGPSDWLLQKDHQCEYQSIYKSKHGLTSYAAWCLNAKDRCFMRPCWLADTLIKDNWRKAGGDKRRSGRSYFWANSLAQPVGQLTVPLTVLLFLISGPFASEMDGTRSLVWQSLHTPERRVSLANHHSYAKHSAEQGWNDRLPRMLSLV